jgi:hypothetical protein
MLPNRSSRRYGGALESDGRPAGLGLAAAGERRPAGNQPGQREDGQHGGEGDVFGFLAVAQVVHGRPHRPDQEVTEDQDQEHRSQRPRPSTQEDQANHDDHDQGQGLAVAADKCWPSDSTTSPTAAATSSRRQVRTRRAGAAFASMSWLVADSEDGEQD